MIYTVKTPNNEHSGFPSLKANPLVNMVVIAALLGYFMGSFPTGFLVGRIAGVDVRKLGSGNVGATNVTRLLGKRFGYPVFAMDFLKGFGAVALSIVFARNNHLGERAVELCGVFGGVFSVIGHSFPIWLGFKGGKGVATSIGVLFGLTWLAAVVVCLVWILVFLVTRYVSLASIAGAIALPITTGAMLWLNRLNTPVLLYFSLCIAALVILRHSSNLARLIHGTEPRFLRK
jgi:acyl phosphate:glycerol-3-phosphate acyltransferase